MNLIQLQSTKEALKKSLHEYERITPACNTCENMRAGQCTHFKATPPPEWVRGPVNCEHWEYDSIPF